MREIPMGFALVVPTYNEVENIPELIRAIQDARLEDPLEVLIVDDGSPDGTGELVKHLGASRPWLHLLQRERPLGLGSAYRAGFQWALAGGYSRIGEMDADLSHDPSVLPQLDRAVLAGADLALGSRYVAGGGSEGWPLSRRMLSRGGNLFARTLLGLSTRDATSGFRVYSAVAVELLLERGTECDGYGFQVEGVVTLTRNGMRIAEVPITFKERQHGRSKMSKTIVWEATRRCFQMAREERVSRRDSVVPRSEPSVSPISPSLTSMETVEVDR